MKYPPLHPVGAKFVSGEIVSGEIVLAREDGTTAAPPPLLMFEGTLVDNGDGTYTLTVPEEG